MRHFFFDGLMDMDSQSTETAQKLYRYLPHGNRFHAIESVRYDAEGRIHCMLRLNSDSVFVQDAFVSPVVLVELLAQAGAFLKLREASDVGNSDPMISGYVVKVHSLSIDTRALEGLALNGSLLTLTAWLEADSSAVTTVEGFLEHGGERRVQGSIMIVQGEGSQ